MCLAATEKFLGKNWCRETAPAGHGDTIALECSSVFVAVRCARAAAAASLLLLLVAAASCREECRNDSNT